MMITVKQDTSTEGTSLNQHRTSPSFRDRHALSTFTNPDTWPYPGPYETSTYLLWHRVLPGYLLTTFSSSSSAVNWPQIRMICHTKMYCSTSTTVLTERSNVYVKRTVLSCPAMRARNETKQLKELATTVDRVGLCLLLTFWHRNYFFFYF